MIVTRPFNYTGPGQEPVFLVPKLVDHFVRRAPRINLGNLDLFRDFSDIRRVVEVYVRLVAQPIQHAVVNICSGRTIHLGSIIELLQEMSGHTIKVVKDPALVRPGEARTIQGDVVIRGERAAIATPIHRALLSLVLGLDRRRQSAT